MTIPEERCDIVMKGGITSGVVYPLAVCKLSEKYRFENIGGTSAGAIAAVLTAAAEYGRDKGGFDKIGKLPDDLSKTLVEKFHPVPKLAGLFKVLLSVMDGGYFVALLRLPSLYWLQAFLGAIPGLASTVYGLAGGGLGFVLLGVLLLILGVFGVAVWMMVRQLTRDLVDNNYGMCPGVSQPGFKGEAISDWITRNVDDVAGHDEDCETPEDLRDFVGASSYKKPLTVGDLKKEGITVKTVTTDVTSQRPYSLPLGENNNNYFFDRREFLQFFPRRVVAHMCATSRPVLESTAKNPRGDLYYFQNTEGMPLVVLARMSLSFPFLFTTVPLYRCDYTFADDAKKREPVKCHFSDGGISSNFPVHFFDHFLPHTPTFGIALNAFDARRYTEKELEEMKNKKLEPPLRSKFPQAISEGQLLPTHTTGGLLGFVMAMFDSARNWQDSLQSILTGYRERIVTVSLKSDEGGLNLNMPKDKIDKLVSFGEAAGDRMVGEFELDEHRWRRLLAEMMAIEEAVLVFSENFNSVQSAKTYPYIAVNYPPVAFAGLTKTTRQRIHRQADELAKLGQQWGKQKKTLRDEKGMPRTRSSLRNIADMGD